MRAPDEDGLAALLAALEAEQGRYAPDWAAWLQEAKASLATLENERDLADLLADLERLAGCPSCGRPLPTAKDFRGQDEKQDE